MRVLFVNGRMLTPFGVGGDTVFLDIILSYLSQHGCSCNAIGTTNHPGYIQYKESIKNKLKRLSISFQNSIQFNILNLSIDTELSYSINGYNVQLVKRNMLNQSCLSAINSFQPDVIFTQLDYSIDILKIARQFTIPIVIFIHDVEKPTSQIICGLRKNDLEIAVFFSTYAMNRFRGITHCHSIRINQPLILPNVSSDAFNRPFITMINPVYEKGGDIMYKIIKSLPNLQFLLVEGWKKISDINIPFPTLPNVTILPKQDNMRNIYDRTKILLIPSVWKESFGRVAIEAESYGIPVIASDRGGLRESVGNGGILLKDYHSVKIWNKTILGLLMNKPLFKTLSQNGQRHIAKYDISRVGPKYFSLCRSLVHTKNELKS